MNNTTFFGFLQEVIRNFFIFFKENLTFFHLMSPCVFLTVPHAHIYCSGGMINAKDKKNTKTKTHANRLCRAVRHRIYGGGAFRARRGESTARYRLLSFGGAGDEGRIRPYV